MFRKVKVDYINSKLIGQRIPLLAIVPDNVFWLKSIKEKKEFNNGKYSDVVTGYIYECIEPVNLEIYSIKVEGQKVPLMTNEQLQNLRNSGQRVIIEAVNASIMSYVTNRNGIEDSCKADDVKLIETEE